MTNKRFPDLISSLLSNGEETRYGPGDWYHLSPNQVHSARFEVDTSEIEFWFKTNS